MIEIDYSVGSGLYDEKIFTEIKGRFSYENDDGKNIIGHLNGKRLNVDLLDFSGFSIKDELKADIYETAPFAVLFDKNGDWKEDLCEGYSPCNDILILDFFSITSPFRGLNIGSFCFRNFLIIFGQNCGFVVGKMEPLQFTHNHESETLRLDKFEQDPQKAYKKLLKYYKKLGFKQYKNTDIIYINPYVTNDLDYIEMINLDYDDMNRRVNELKKLELIEAKNEKKREEERRESVRVHNNKILENNG